MYTKGKVLVLKRVFAVVLDSFGIGALPDAADYSDKGSNTLHSISRSEYFDAHNLISLGLGNIRGCGYIGKAEKPTASFGRLRELSAGKDTTIGHWELAGLVSDKPFPTYPEGFPEEIISAFEQATGRKVLCNRPYSGTQAIKDFGAEHIETGALIVYTSADSVFQIAAHESVVPPEQLYEYCRAARRLLQGEHAVGRVIARPFEGEHPEFVRTSRRHDFSLEPVGQTVLDAVCAAGKQCVGIGKIGDIFAGRGLTESIPTTSNADGMAKLLEMASGDFEGLCFANLVDFDMLYGHRNDIDGYARALAQFDSWLPQLMAAMREDDLLLITADHGCDPGFPHTDHTREYVPLLMYSPSLEPKELGTIRGFASVAATVADALEVYYSCPGESLLK